MAAVHYPHNHANVRLKRFSSVEIYEGIVIYGGEWNQMPFDRQRSVAITMLSHKVRRFNAVERRDVKRLHTSVWFDFTLLCREGTNCRSKPNHLLKICYTIGFLGRKLPINIKKGKNVWRSPKVLSQEQTKKCSSKKNWWLGGSQAPCS